MGAWRLAGVAGVSSCVLIAAAVGIGPASARSSGITTGQSYWGGYVALAAQSQTFVSTSATFTIPALDCSASLNGPGDAVQIWSALDGAYPGAPLAIEQAGVQPGCSGGGQQNPAYYDIQYVNRKGKTVIAVGLISLNGTYDLPTGDSITATVSHSRTEVTMTVRDNTTGASGSVTKTCPKGSCPYESAEAFLEQLGRVSSFDAIAFDRSTATDSKGHMGTLVAPWWNTEQLTWMGKSATGSRVACATTGPYDSSSGAFVMTSTGQCVSGS